jgi:excisionase family DNA binding protein
MREESAIMTTMTLAIASSAMLFLLKRTATRYARGMPKKQKQVDPLYTVARYTTTQAAEMLGIKRVTVYSAIQRGNLETELASPGTHLISQAAIDAYRAHHLGQVGQPTRKKQKMMMKMAEARQPAAADRSSAAASRTPDTPDGDVEGAG